MSEKTIEEKFEEWIKDNAMNRLYMSDYFRAGYEVAQKEMQEKLDAVIRSKGVACLKHDLIHHIGCGHCIDEAIGMIERIVDSQYRSDVSHFDVMNEAQDFLKARGE